ncbi:MAG: hypothetical protein MUC42_05030 [Bryobacter sp.]|nr:hypothetical protein [Bryobacter sp.]
MARSGGRAEETGFQGPCEEAGDGFSREEILKFHREEAYQHQSNCNQQRAESDYQKDHLTITPQPPGLPPDVERAHLCGFHFRRQDGR